MPQVDGALVSPESGRSGKLAAAELQPETGLFYVNATDAYSVYYIFDQDEKPEGWGGNDRGGWSESTAAGDRLQNRQDQMESQVGRRGRSTLRRACLLPAIWFSQAIRRTISWL